MRPRVSVVVPTYRRPALLEQCLAALAQQTLPGTDYEIVIVHDGPDERSPRVVDFRRQGAPPVRRFALAEHRGPAAARNRGCREARADVIAFTDDDTVPEPRWLESGLAALGADAAAAWGRLVMPLRASPSDYERDAAGLASAPFVTANCFVRRSALEESGGFDERFERAWREDSDLYFTLLRAGARIVHVPQATVVHPIRPAPWGISVRQQRKILFDALLYKKHPALYRERIRAQPRWDYYAAVGALAGLTTGVVAGAPVAAAVAGTAWLALTARFAAARLKSTSKRAAHVAEMIVTSAAIPPTAVFWRLVGAVRYRVLFL